MWTFLLSLINKQDNFDPMIEQVFKADNPKCYVQVKTSIIGEDNPHLIAIFSDVTKIKEY